MSSVVISANQGCHQCSSAAAHLKERLGKHSPAQPVDRLRIARHSITLVTVDTTRGGGGPGAARPLTFGGWRGGSRACGGDHLVSHADVVSGHLSSEAIRGH